MTQRRKFLLEVTILTNDKDIIDNPLPYLHVDMDEVPYLDFKVLENPIK